MTHPAFRQARVLLFAPRPSDGGGVEYFVGLLERVLGPGVIVDRFNVGRRAGLPGTVFRFLTPMTDAVRLAGLLVFSRRHDVYHLNPSLLPFSLLRDGLFLLTLRLFRRRHVLVFFHGWNTRTYSRICNHKILRWLFRSVYGAVPRLMVLSSRFKRDLAQLGLETDAIHVTSTMFDGRTLEQVTRNRSVTNARVQILFMSRLVIAKGIYELLEAFRELAADTPLANLVVAGDGPEAKSAREWCTRHGLAERVEFTGYLTGKNKAQLLANADIFALPSHGEGCPIALLEAMAAGLPVVVTAVGGIPDIVKDEVNGIVLKTSASQPLTKALLRLVADPTLRKTMGLRNKADAFENYEARIVASKIESSYRALAGLGDYV